MAGIAFSIATWKITLEANLILAWMNIKQYIDHIASYTWGVPHFAGNFGVVQVKHDGQSSNITSNGCDYSCLMVWDYQKSLVVINHRSRMATLKKMGMFPLTYVVVG